MCRSTTEVPTRGRRCPGGQGPVANIRARISRYEKAAQRANEAQDWEKVARYADLLERDIGLYRDAAYSDASARRPPVGPTRAGEFTIASTATWSDEGLAHAYNEVAEADDLAAMEALERVMDRRDEIDKQRANEYALRDAEKQRKAAINSWDYHHDPNPLTNPAVRRDRRPVNRERECRAEYDSYLYTQYLKAEKICNGNMLNPESAKAGMNPEILFDGSKTFAYSHASKELTDFFEEHGRVTYAEWKYAALGRSSDRRAAQTARHQNIKEYVH